MGTKVHLFFISGAKKGKIESTECEVIRIGRQPFNEVQLDPYGDIPASGSHAQIVCEGPDRFSIVDSGSTWGTWKNDERISGRVPLTTGDVITLGRDDQGRQGPQLRFYLDKHIRRCPACQGPVYKRNFTCPACQTKYCLRCIDFHTKTCKLCAANAPAAQQPAAPPAAAPPPAQRRTRVLATGAASPADAPFCVVCCDFVHGRTAACPSCGQTVCVAHRQGQACAACAGAAARERGPELAAGSSLAAHQHGPPGTSRGGSALGPRGRPARPPRPGRSTTPVPRRAAQIPSSGRIQVPDPSTLGAGPPSSGAQPPGPGAPGAPSEDGGDGIEVQRPPKVLCERCASPLAPQDFFICDRCRGRLCTRHLAKDDLCDECAGEGAATAPSASGPGRADPFARPADAGPPTSAQPTGSDDPDDIETQHDLEPGDLIETADERPAPPLSDALDIGGAPGPPAAAEPGNAELADVQYECPACDGPVASGATRCPSCGREL